MVLPPNNNVALNKRTNLYDINISMEFGENNSEVKTSWNQSVMLLWRNSS